MPKNQDRRRPGVPLQRSRATVAMGFVTGMLSGLEALGIAADDMLQAAGISLGCLVESDGACADR